MVVSPIRKGTHTRNMIVEKAAILLNQKGYIHSSVYDVMRETGLQKGGIYNHFRSKEELTIEAYRFAVTQMRIEFEKALLEAHNSLEALFEVLEVFRNLAHGHPLKGGCPTMNIAIESDDADPVLCEEARNTMSQLHKTVQMVVSSGKTRRELIPACDPEQVATILISTVEGALMLSKLFQDTVYMDRAVTHLQSYLTSFVSKREENQGENAYESK